ncbi:MAG: hypothetical protein J5J00_02035, partial [Deltaproteobacteria bacterium]|nr:hypothetical protein [Deltaproteobacteria bacterium]
ERFEQLVELLDSDDWRIREQGREELVRLGEAAVALIHDLDRSQLTAQQNALLDHVISRFKEQMGGRTYEQILRIRQDSYVYALALKSGDTALREIGCKGLESSGVYVNREAIETDGSTREDEIARIWNYLKDKGVY